jgi:hypothetical protein
MGARVADYALPQCDAPMGKQHHRSREITCGIQEAAHQLVHLRLGFEQQGSVQGAAQNHRYEAASIAQLGYKVWPTNPIDNVSP